MHLHRPLVLAAVATSLAAHPAASQAPDWCVLEGQRVRVHGVGDATYQGRSLGCSGATLLVEVDGGSDRPAPYLYRSVPFAEIQGVDVGRGTRRRIARSVIAGAAIVGTLFGGFGYLTGHDGAPCATGYCVRVSRSRKVVAGLAAGVVLGGGGGLLYGLHHESDIWEPWPEVPLAAGGGWTLVPDSDWSLAPGSDWSLAPSLGGQVGLRLTVRLP